MRVKVTTTARAVVTEEWVVEVPDGTDPEDAFDRAFGTDATGKVISVDNTSVDGEDDREVESVEVIG